jgi:hypothetical protein
MPLTRREFMRTLMIGSTILRFTGGGIATDILLPKTSAAASNNSELLDEMERASFEFFWNEANPYTGLVRDRSEADGGSRSRMSSIAATGFGLTALCIAHQRNYRPRAEITARVRRTLHFLEHAPHVHGFLYHYVDIGDGRRFAKSELSPDASDSGRVLAQRTQAENRLRGLPIYLHSRTVVCPPVFACVV